jgi:tRNA(Ile)-lysidine synthase
MTHYREIKSRIISFIAENDLIQFEDRILIAVSGGIDSMFLLNVLLELRDELSIYIAIGHINHNIRPNSTQDEEFVVNYAKRLGIECQVSKLNITDKIKRENIEAWARRKRYNKLEEIRANLKLNKIATAHHSNDQIETILQRLSEKSGIDGLRGIHKQRGNIIRPILSITKKEIQEVANYLSMEYIDDETNQDINLTRNYFRHKVVPHWEALYPKLGNSFQRISELIEVNHKILDYFFIELKNKIVLNHSKNTISIKIEDLNKLPNIVSITFMHYVIEGKNWRKHNWHDLEQIYKNAKTGKIYNFKGSEILKDRDKWLIRPKFKVDQKPVQVTIGNVVEIGDQIVRVQKVGKIILDKNLNREYIDFSKVEGKKLVVRLWREGDTFKPLKMEGSKLISDYLIDEKINSFEKQKQLVLTADGKIIWLCGKRLSDTVKIDKSTKEYLELSIQ